MFYDDEFCQNSAPPSIVRYQVDFYAPVPGYATAFRGGNAGELLHEMEKNEGGRVRLLTGLYADRLVNC